MKKMIFVSISMVVLFLGCAGERDRFAAFPFRERFTVNTEDFSDAAEPDPDFLPHVHPFARAKVSGKGVLVGFIPFAEEYIEGVAYLVSEKGEVLDTLVLSYEDPPGYQVGEVGDLISIERFDDVIEDGGVGNTEKRTFSSKLVYEVMDSWFVRKIE